MLNNLEQGILPFTNNCQIYAKDRASGRDAQTAADILEKIAEVGNTQTAEEPHDFEDGNQSQLGLEEMDISST